MPCRLSHEEGHAIDHAIDDDDDLDDLSVCPRAVHTDQSHGYRPRQFRQSDTGSIYCGGGRFSDQPSNHRSCKPRDAASLAAHLHSGGMVVCHYSRVKAGAHGEYRRAELASATGSAREIVASGPHISCEKKRRARSRL